MYISIVLNEIIKFFLKLVYIKKLIEALEKDYYIL
jgi:hypothetical protein